MTRELWGEESIHGTGPYRFITGTVSMRPRADGGWITEKRNDRGELTKRISTPPMFTITYEGVEPKPSLWRRLLAFLSPTKEKPHETE